MYHNLNLAYAALLDACNLERVVLVVNLLMDREEVALYLEQQSGESVCVALNVCKLLVVDVQNLAEVGE